MKPRILLLCCLSLMPLFGGEDRFWDKQDASAWTPDQTRQFLSASPWAKQVTAVLTSNDSNMAGATPRSGGGGGRRGAVYSSRGNTARGHQHAQISRDCSLGQCAAHATATKAEVA